MVVLENIDQEDVDAFFHDVRGKLASLKVNLSNLDTFLKSSGSEEIDLVFKTKNHIDRAYNELSDLVTDMDKRIKQERIR